MPETGILLCLIEWSSFGPSSLSTCSNGNGPSSYKSTIDNSNTDKSKYQLYCLYKWVFAFMYIDQSRLGFKDKSSMLG